MIHPHHFRPLCYPKHKRPLLGHHRDSHRNQDTIQFVAKMPVSAFEAAFTSGGLNPNDLASDSELLSSVVSYLNEAASVNTLVDFYLGLVRGLSSAEQNKRRSLVNEIIDRSEHVIQVLGQLERCLTVELENAVSR